MHLQSHIPSFVEDLISHILNKFPKKKKKKKKKKKNSSGIRLSTMVLRLANTLSRLLSDADFIQHQKLSLPFL
jgi:hypothetical protein